MARDHNYYVYIMTNWQHTVLYTGMTNDVVRRFRQHANGIGGRFTKQYHANKLVHCEHTSEVEAAIRREKEIKGWSRQKKMDLIAETNPEWRDLSEDLGLAQTRCPEQSHAIGCCSLARRRPSCHSERSERSERSEES